MRTSVGSDRVAVDAAPLGSEFDLATRHRSTKRPWRRLRGWLTWHLVGLVAAVWPRLYMAYCWLVWKTSRVIDGANPTLAPVLDRHGRAVCLLWHQEVFTVAWAYRPTRPHTLASAGDLGRLVTRMLERCGFVVFRGGSSSRASRRRAVLPSMIRHMRNQAGPVLYGVTVDGSRGPAYRLKGGMLAVARACRAPVYLVRTWYRRRVELPTWDRTALPLPWNEVELLAVGPYWIPPDCTADELEQRREHLERELQELCALSHRRLDGTDAPPPGFPEGWRPRWTADRRGVPFGPHDLRPDAPPPWASAPGPQRRV